MTESINNGESDPINSLYRKIDITSETRFHASRRLMLHNKMSTATNVLMSLFLILVSLMQILEIGANINGPFTILFQVFASIVVLIFSIISNKNNYLGSAEKLYACASEIVKLKRELKPFQLSGDSSSYSAYESRYNDILEKYQSHTVDDFRADYIKALTESKRYGFKNPWEESKNKAFWMLSYAKNFISYIFLWLSLLPIMWIVGIGQWW